MTEELYNQLEEKNQRIADQARQIAELRQQLAEVMQFNDGMVEDVAACHQQNELLVVKYNAAKQERLAAVSYAARLKNEWAAEREMVLELLEAWMDAHCAVDEIGETIYASTREYLVEFHPDIDEDMYPHPDQMYGTYEMGYSLEDTQPCVAIEAQSL